MLIYGSTKFVKVKDRLDTSFQRTTQTNAIRANEAFTFEEIGANFAFGIAGFRGIESTDDLRDYVTFNTYLLRYENNKNTE